MIIQSVIRSALHTEIFNYVCACPNLQLDIPSVRKQFTCQGYSGAAIDLAITDLETDGSVSITDNGFIRIGDDSAQQAA